MQNASQAVTGERDETAARENFRLRDNAIRQGDAAACLTEEEWHQAMIERGYTFPKLFAAVMQRDELLAVAKRVALILDESDEAQMLWEVIGNVEKH